MGEDGVPSPATQKTQLFWGSPKSFVISFKQIYSFNFSQFKWAPITYHNVRFGRDPPNS